MQEDYDEFINSFNKFNKKHFGHSFVPERRYFELVQSNHKKIRKLLGGISVDMVMQVENSQKRANKKKAMPILTQLFPNSLTHYDEDFWNQFLQPYMKQDEKRIKSTSKFLNNLCSVGNKDKLLAELGQLWAAAKTTKETYKVKIDTSAMGFIKLGYYGPDYKSCFKIGKERECDKFSLGQSEETFVLTICKEDSEIIEYRCWGAYLDIGPTKYIVYTNTYYAPRAKIGNMLECIKTAASEVLQLAPESMHVQEDNSLDVSEDIYINDSGGLIYSNKPIEILDVPTLKINSECNYEDSDCLELEGAA